MRNTIKKILKENEFEWAEEPLDIPLDEIESWVNGNINTVSKYIQRLQELENKLPKVDWDDTESLYTTETQNTLGIIQIKNDLRNIYDSLEQTISGIDEIKGSQ